MPKSLKNRAKGFVKTSSKIAEKALPKINFKESKENWC